MREPTFHVSLENALKCLHARQGGLLLTTYMEKPFSRLTVVEMVSKIPNGKFRSNCLFTV